METSAFVDKSSTPVANELVEVLGRAAPAWQDLEEQIASRFEPVSRDWVFGGQKYGWSLRLKRKKRAIVYLTPCRNHFRAGFALGEKAVAAAHESDLPRAILDVIDSSQKFAEGRAVRLEVRWKKDIRSVIQVAEIKMAN